MEMMGEREPGKLWCRCTRCRHSSLLNIDELKLQESKRKKPEDISGISVDKCTQYSPDKTYSVGEAIYHKIWQEVGKVTAKARISNGGQAIVVLFEKSGERKLVENLKPEVV
jgi:hypothetical protein